MDAEMYDHFNQCLMGDITTSWEDTLGSGYPQESQRMHPNWDTAHYKFMGPQDVMIRFMEAKVTKKAVTPCLNHYHHWKENLKNAKKLPAGVKSDPTKEETKE